MLFEGLTWAWNRFRPREGWFSFLLLLLVLVVLNMAILAVGWIPEDSVIIPATALGLLMGVVLAKRATPSWFSWLLITLYGVLIVVLTLGQLWPPLDLLFSDWPALRLYWLENGGLFFERSAAWISAVSVGGRSNETIIFALIMGLLAWFLAAYLGWSAYHNRQPLLGLTLLGLLVAVNGYFGQAPIEWAVAFVGLAILATATFHLANLQWRWDQRLVDYSTQIRLELILYAGVIGFALLAISFMLPTLSVDSVVRLFLGSESVAALEETLERAFGGVDVPRNKPVSPGQPGGRGILPRAFLLGNPPELDRIIMMTATAEIIEGPPQATLASARHWRSLSYAVYTGRGWALDEENSSHFLEGQPLPAPEQKSQMLIQQNVHWRYDNRIVRYTLGRPTQVDHAVTAYWLDEDDLIRVNGVNRNEYELQTLLSAATAEELSVPSSEPIPEALQRRYTKLPNYVPERVHDLARDVAGGLETPYEQAIALERFLRQYEYSLDVSLPPPDVDVVDFFLFDLQEGYCDYYASAMVVMARSLGLPARLATGFLAQEPDEEGVQTIRQINAHAWAEIYLAGYGWVEFEPTASFVTVHDPQWAASTDYRELLPAAPGEPPEPIPERDPQTEETPVWPRIATALATALVFGALLWWLRSRRRLARTNVQVAYANLLRQAKKLGQESPPDQTPYEFNVCLQEQLNSYGDYSRQAKQAQKVRRPAQELTTIFVEHQYSEDPPDTSQEARLLWLRLRRPLWLLRLGRLFVKQ